MNLIETLAAPAAAKPVPKSKMDVWVDSRPEAEQSAIFTAAINPEWEHVGLLNALVAAGAPTMSDNAFRMWRIKVGWKK